MRYLFLLLLILPFSIHTEEFEFKEGDEFLAKKYETIALFLYRADATRVNIARDLSYSLNDFMSYAAVDQRDIYKIRKGETFVLTETLRDGDIFEVLTTLNLKPTKNEFEKIKTEIVYSTIVELQKDKIEKNDIEKIVLVNVPSEIYSDLRKIFINLFENSGFKDIKISENVDFQKLYNMKKIQ